MPNRRRKNPTAREVLAANMDHLMKRGVPGNPGPISARWVAEKAECSPGTVTKICKTVGPSPQLNKIEPIAEVFGLQAWQLLMPELPAMLGHTGEVSRILESYLHSDVEGRRTLNDVASRIASHRTDNDE